MGRRILAFFLGFIFAFVVIAGGIAIAVFAVKVNQYAPGSDKYLGDLANLSIYNVGQSLYKLYGEKTMQDENGKYFTLEQFCENYNIDLNAALNGMELPQEVLDIPAFELFREGGMDRAMKQIKVSALPAIANLFGGKNEDGTSNGMFTDEMVAELAKFSLYDMLVDENVGIAGVFANVRVADVLPDSFPAENSDNKLMWAVGQTKIGGLLNGMSGSESILLQLKTGGAFETLGSLELTSVLGESEYVSAIMGSKAVFADLIGDDGSIRFDDIINGVSIGQLLGCQKNDTLDVNDYANEVLNDSANGAYVKSKTVGVGESAKTLYIMSANNEEWFEAELKCKNAEETHTHTADCFKYVWYSATECVSTEHNHETNGDMIKDNVPYARTDGLYSVLAGLSITDLTSGSSDELIKELKVLKISDVMGEGQVSGIMEAFVDFTIEELMNGAIDDMYLGEFFNLKREAIQNLSGYDLSEENVLRVCKERDNSVLAYFVATDADGNIAMSLDKETWYVGKKECDSTEEGHVHNENCYSYVWRNKDTDELAEGVQNKLASKQIADMQYLNEEIQNMTLTDVFGKDAVPEMLKSIAEVKIGELSEHIDTIQLGTLLGYDGGLTCENAAPDHVHDHDCYAWTDKEGQPVTGMMAKLAYKTVGDMGNLNETIKTFTLHDVLGEDIPDMLKSLADVEIGGLNTAINGMYLGDFLEYTCSYDGCDNVEEGHEHSVAACSHVWTDKHGTEVTGMMAKIADKTVSELSDMDSIVNDLTLRDVLGENIPAMLKDVADTKVKDIGTAIDDIYLGSALSYSRKEIDANGYGSIQNIDNVKVLRQSGQATKYIKTEDGETWYEAIQACKSKEHDATNTHTADCYRYVWYTDEACTAEVDGVAKALVNTKVKDVGNKIDTMTLGEMGIGEGNTILEALQDTPINRIADDINAMEMGVVLGYEKRYTCGQDHEHTTECAYMWIAECTDNHEDGSASSHMKADHITIDGKLYFKASGLNLKIADNTVANMNSATLSDIALSLTIGDLIDSGMIVLDEENQYKLALIFSDGQHSFKEIVTLPGIGTSEQTFTCDIARYSLYQTAHSGTTITAKAYWYKCHGFASDEQLDDTEIAHRDTWKSYTLKEFVNNLLEHI